jgi:hypothetical protein
MKPLLSVLFILTAFAAFSQINYEPGYFTDNNGHRTECLIKNLAWKNSPEDFEYKTNETAEAEVGTIQTVAEFSVGNYKFKRFDTEIDLSSNQVSKMVSYKDPKWIQRTLFLKVLVEGKLNLYAYEGENVVKYFYSEGSHAKATQLLYKVYLTKNEKTAIEEVAKNSMYKQQLYNLMKDKFSDAGKFEKTAYKKEPLVKLFVDYNGNDTKNLSAGHNKGSFNLKINVGASMASISIKDNYKSRIDYTTDTKTVFMAGLEAEYILPFNNNKWSVFTAPNIQFFSAEDTQYNDHYETTFNWDIKYNFIEIPLGARHYMFLNQQSKLFIDLAFVISMPMGDKTMDFYPAVGSIDISSATNFALGVGYNYKRYSAAVKYNFSRDITNYASWEGKYNSVGLILGYKLF